MVVKQGRLYLAFKYAVYLLLTINVGVFFFEALAGAEYAYSDGIRLSELIIAYADPIDTAAWLVLLLMLELETFIIEDDVLKGPLYWGINAINTVCYGFIIYSFYGYYGTVEIPNGFAPYAGVDPCTLIDSGAAFLNELDDYEPLSVANCGSLSTQALFNAELNMFSTVENWNALVWEAWLDVVNSGVWIIIVTVLQLEIYLRRYTAFGTRFFIAYKYAKLALYAVLFVACYLWFSWGMMWDAWDAFLWLVAFFFIEMNVLNWQQEIAQENESAAHQTRAW